MAQQKVIQLPQFVTTLLAAIERRFPGCQVDAEPINGGKHGNYRIAIVSGEFEGVGLMDRQELVWSVVEQVLSHDEQRNILMILSLTPSELEGED